jgi:molybdopterin-guanine dinucleotide biosynthesis protein A
MPDADARRCCRHPEASLPQPLAAAYARSAAALLASRLEAGERSATAAALSLEVVLLDDLEIETMEGGATNFFNVNAPEDLAEAERLLASREAPRRAS